MQTDHFEKVASLQASHENRHGGCWSSILYMQHAVSRTRAGTYALLPEVRRHFKTRAGYCMQPISFRQASHPRLSTCVGVFELAPLNVAACIAFVMVVQGVQLGLAKRYSVLASDRPSQRGSQWCVQGPFRVSRELKADPAKIAGVTITQSQRQSPQSSAGAACMPPLQAPQQI